MEIRHILASELVEFAEKASSHYQGDIPITPWRAISQSNNPYAKSDDILLIVVEENRNLLGYIGILPGIVGKDSGQRIFWNSCWWTDPDAGALVSMTLLSEFMKATSKSVAFSDLSERTKEIIQKLGFEVHVRNGVLIKLRSALYSRSAVLPKRNFKSKSLMITRKLGILFAIDIFLNLFSRSVFSKLDLPDNVNLSEHSIPDSEINSFIEEHARNSITIPSTKYVEWVVSKAWLVQGNKQSKEIAGKYYFSSLQEDFKTWVQIVRRGEDIIGCAILSRKEAVLKTHFLYYSEDDKRLFFRALVDVFSKDSGNHRLLTFHEEFTEYLIAESRLKNRIKKFKRYTAISSVFSDEDKTFVFQDGDGDYIFT